VFELGDISGADFGVPGVDKTAPNKVSSQAKSAHSKSNVNAAAAAIQHPVHGKTAGIQQGLHNAGTVISLTQTLQSALSDLYGQQTQIKATAEKLSKGSFSDSEKVGVQRALRDMVKNFNKTVDNIEYGGNKLFGGGNAMSIRVGGDSKVDIKAENFRIDVGGGGAFVDPDVLLEKMEEKMGAVKDYNGFLNNVRQQVKETAGQMQFELESAFESGLNTNGVNSKSEAGVLARNREQAEKVMENQAEVEPERALELLKDRPAEGNIMDDVLETPPLWQSDGKDDVTRIPPLWEQGGKKS
jgi:flagellin-like hook-associated protein FlgL